MRKRSLVLSMDVISGFLGLSLAGICALPLATGNSSEIPGQAFRVQDPDRFRKPVFERVEVKENILFRTAPNAKGNPEDLRLDVYLPAGDTARSRPAILWIHGGGFRPGNDKKQKYIVSMANEFARRGYVSVAPDYRVRERPDENRKAALMDAVEDCRAALSWMRDNVETYRIDPGWVALAGGSAGGMIAVNLAALENAEAAKSGVRGVFALIDLWGSPAASLRLGQIDRHYPPTIIIHGTGDKTVPYSQSEQLAAELKEMHINHLLVPIPDAPHTPIEHMAKIVEESAKFLYAALTGKSQ